jgi:hypothetical protein
MTDHPRFELVRGEPDRAHLNYNGGAVVDWVLRLIDWWLAVRKGDQPASSPSASAHLDAAAATPSFGPAQPTASRSGA